VNLAASFDSDSEKTKSCLSCLCHSCFGTTSGVSDEISLRHTFMQQNVLRRHQVIPPQLTGRCFWIGHQQTFLLSAKAQITLCTTAYRFYHHCQNTKKRKSIVIYRQMYYCLLSFTAL